MATAIFQKLNRYEAVIEVNYDFGGFAFERITLRRPLDGDLYEVAYNAASFKARVHGEELTRFSRG